MVAPFHCPPVSGVELYKSDVRVLREGGNGSGKAAPREDITEFSYASRQRLAFVAANTNAKFYALLTLTYPAEFPTDGEIVKRHHHAFLTWHRRHYSTTYLWFLEFQKRGAPHIHILSGYRLPTDNEERKVIYNEVGVKWYDIVGSKDPAHLQAGTRTEAIRKADGATRYAVKYACKMYQKVVPERYQNVGRFWGHSKDVAPVPFAEVQVCADDILTVLDGKPFAPRDSQHIWSCLYGASKWFAAYLDDQT